MATTGKCYCGALAYEYTGDAIFKGQCHCRECRYFSGGFPNAVMGVPEDGFTYTKGEPKSFIRPDLDAGVNREFCGECGTHIGTRSPGMPGVMLLKMGSLDDPNAYSGPDMAVFAKEKLDFHHIADGVATFDTVPG